MSLLYLLYLLVWSKVKAYLLYVASFVFGVYCNMQALSHSNVETVIVFRSCTPLAVSLCDYLFLYRELPSSRSLGALLIIAVGALGIDFYVIYIQIYTNVYYLCFRVSVFLF